jgi:hypothetical protein
MPVDSTWETFPCEKAVLMACRSLTATIRLLETHQLFRDDVRLRFHFTVDPGSPFSATSEHVLRGAGISEIVDWADADTVHPDLTLTASENVDSERLDGAVIVLPHGIGFNKYVPTADGTGRRLAGLPSPAALRTGRVRLTLAHPDQDTQLRQASDEIAGHTVVTGDPVLDQLTASLPFRDRYRALLHAADRRVVLLSSTWAQESLLGRWWTLPAELLGTLAADDHVVCLALHPNIWAKYGPLGVRTYLARALDAGLVLLPPESHWQAAMVASDVVVADHGSLALYAAALDKPLLLTGRATEIVPGTPMADLADAAHHLDQTAPLAPQLDRAAARPAVRAAADRAFAHRGDAVERLYRELYRSLDLDPPADLPRRRVPDPTALHRGPWSFRVHVANQDEVTTLVRYPATVAAAELGHLVVTDDEPDLRLHERAAAVCRPRSSPPDAALAWVRTTVAGHPGARLAAAAVPGGCVVLSRDGRQAMITADADVTVLTSIAYDRLLDGGFDGRVRVVSVGGQRVPVRITPTQ